MAMSRKGKIWSAIVGIPLIVLACGIAAAKLYFTSDRLKALVIPRVEATVHRPVNIRSISLGIFPSLAVDVDSLTIANARGRGFAARPMIELGRLTLKVRLFSLLSGKVEVSSVLLDQPHLLLEVNEWGETNYAGLGGGAEQPVSQGAPPSQAPTSGTALVLSNVQIRDGLIEYVDHQGNSQIRVTGLNHTMTMDVGPGEVRLDGQTSVDRLSYGTLRASMIPDLRLTMDEELVYDRTSDRLTIRKGTVTVQDMILTASGTISSASTKPVLAVVVESDKLSIADLLSLVPAEYMKKAEGLKGTGTARIRLSVDGAIGDSAVPAFKGTIAATDASVRYAQLPQPITNVNLVATFERSVARQEFTLEKFSASLGANPLTATLRVVNFSDPWISLSVHASLNLAEVKDYYPLEQGTQLSGSLAADLTIAGKVNTPTAMTGSGTMDFRNVTIRTAESRKPLQNLQGTITVTNNLIDSKKISMVIGQSDLTLGFTMKNYLSVMSEDRKAPKATASLSLASTRLVTADIMTDTGATKGTPSRGGRNPQPSGKGGLVLPNVDMDVTATVGTLVMERFTFTNMRAQMSVSNGVITLRSCTLGAFDGSVTTRGTLNLQKPERPTFDFAMSMANIDAHAMLPKFTSFGERMQGRLSMQTNLTGALDDTLGLVPQSLNGQGHVQASNGSLTGVKINSSIASLLKLPDLETIRYKDWSNDFSVSNGRLVIKDLKITALDADYIVNGSQGLDGSLDYSMSLVLPEKTSSRISIAGFAGQAVDLFRDNTGRVKLDFAVGGTMDEPRVSLDTKAAQKKGEDLLKQKAADETKKLKDQLQKKGEDLLQELLKKKKK